MAYTTVLLLNPYTKLLLFRWKTQGYWDEESTLTDSISI